MQKPISLKYADAIKAINSDWKGSVSGDIEKDIVINWAGETEISVSDIKAKITAMDKAETDAAKAKTDLKASAKAKLIAGEKLTEDEANTIVL